ncbi:MAG TPA: rhomboid family intramembrane serine protease [Xanthobacteraceae bacterium]
MAIDRTDRQFFEVPHAAVYLLITANIVAYVLCFRTSGVAAIPGELLFRDGAMYSAALARHEYWRLVTYGFLHADPLHLATNMLCLALWGGPLEKRIGSTYFMVIYLFALVFAALVSNFTHAGPYLTVGASGAISGILGALFGLWILAKIDVTANFFVANIGLNVVLALTASRIDWGAHLGGFAAGVISCALLDLLEKANALVLRCKFPEFVKMNCFILAGGVGMLVWGGRPAAALSGPQAWLWLAAVVAAGLAAVKTIDVLLSVKKGLAIVVGAFAVANAALLFFAGRALASLLATSCVSYYFPPLTAFDRLVRMACANLGLTLDIAAACAFALTILAYFQELNRGIRDVGFVGAALCAERKRHQGI